MKRFLIPLVFLFGLTISADAQEATTILPPSATINGTVCKLGQTCTTANNLIGLSLKSTAILIFGRYGFVVSF